jgi:hypothetical protein
MNLEHALNVELASINLLLFMSFMLPLSLHSAKWHNKILARMSYACQTSLWFL